MRRWIVWLDLRNALLAAALFFCMGYAAHGRDFWQWDRSSETSKWYQTGAVLSRELFRVRRTSIVHATGGSTTVLAGLSTERDENARERFEHSRCASHCCFDGRDGKRSPE